MLPPEHGKYEGNKGEVLKKIYMKSIPTVVFWDQTTETGRSDNDRSQSVDDNDGDSDDDIWGEMEEVDDDLETRKKPKRLEEEDK